MKYMGSKNRIAKYFLPIILKDRKENQWYVEPFVGGANMIDKVDGNRIGADNNKYLIAMWKALQSGWIPPKKITREFYNQCRDKYNKGIAKENEYHIIGYVGFNGSYSGKFYGGYAGIVTAKSGKVRNYPLEAYNNIVKQVNNIKDIKFIYSNYTTLDLPENSIIYCDPPYADVTKYKTANNFNYKEFWQWCRDKTVEGHKVFISEYNAPDDFVCIWQKEVSSSLRANGKISGDKKSTEKLFVYKG
jgi:DNA adenine methylase